MAWAWKFGEVASKFAGFTKGTRLPESKPVAELEQGDQQPATATAGKRFAADDADGMRLELGGEANAVWENTHAEGNVSSRVVDLGPVTIARGNATFGASAQSSEDEIAYAAADSYADADGADIAITTTRKTTGTSQGDGQASMNETSQTRVFAIDIQGIDLPIGPIVLDRMVSHSGPGRPQPAEGNVAELTVDAEARGDNTSVGVDGTVLTVEDQYSGVTAVVVTEVA